jgi:hypothetical protein
MTWYEWGIKIVAINNHILQRKQDHELLIEMFRSSLTYINNWKGGKATKTDFWRLSSDDTQPDKEDIKELQEHTIQRLERIAKKRKQQRG